MPKDYDFSSPSSCFFLMYRFGSLFFRVFFSIVPILLIISTLPRLLFLSLSSRKITLVYICVFIYVCDILSFIVKLFSSQ